MKQGIVETIVGFIVIIIATAFLWFAYTTSSSSKGKDGYLLTASFQNIESLNIGDEVKLAGMKIGYVDEILLEKDTYYVQVKIRVTQDIKLPKDSRAVVSTSGLLGGNYIRINPGASEEDLAKGDEIKLTQSALNIEELIGKLMYAITSK